MNTPNTTPCSADDLYCRFGAETILKLTDGFMELIEGVIADEDIEYVHKTRVASRRLRAALPVFQDCFAKKQFKAWKCDVKQVTKLLSSARDLDVQIAFLEQYIEKLSSPAEQAAMKQLLKSHRSRRRSVQGNVEEGLKELKEAGTLEEIRGVCGQALSDQPSLSLGSASVVEKAHWHISVRLDEFLSMQKYVHVEGADQQHHQMRIRAKRLRYTMEFFASLYPDKLEKEIDMIKNFQDELGELHDSIVWLQYVQALKKNSPKSAKAPFKLALNNFSDYLQNRRSGYYGNFVKLWNQCCRTGFFAQLRKTVSLIVLSGAEAMAGEKLKHQRVRIAVLSDIHANLHALESVLEDAHKRGVTVFVNVGDSIGYGACPNEVVELLCRKGVLSILGNYDLEVLEDRSDAKGEKRLAFKYAQKALSGGARSYLEMLPHELRLQAADKKLLVTHGSPRSIDEHIYPDIPEEGLKELADLAGADVVLVGHSHRQFQRSAGNVVFLNPGSVGRPDDGNPQAAYALLDFNPFKAELIRLSYPVKAAAMALRLEGLPETYAQMLLRGVSLDEVMKRDRGREKAFAENCRETVAACEEYSKMRWPDVEHYLQVTNLALALFDGLSTLHRLGSRERCWLECASILHDIGLSVEGGKHNKNTAEIILNDTSLPITSKDRRIIAALAKYHRGGLPKRGQYLLCGQGSRTIQKICVLASILRVADSLDYSHESAVKLLGIRVAAKRVTVECFSKSELALEQQAFNKKKDLFEKVFNRKMVLEWKQP
ncbi:MAG: YfcE family phosphodiesterase [Candidatus Bathyarchaeota archaeon]|nr:YfcE family phosphodiesterase [Candidatus Bathyarchaeota archaeon]